jgi:mannose-binding lectin 1
LPAGNTFGITAATPENPDSFEIFKFILESATGQGSTIPSSQQPILNEDPLKRAQPVNNLRSDGTMVSAEGFAAQIADLSGRLQLSNKATNIIIQKLETQLQKAEQRHAELLQKIMVQDRQQTSLNAQFDAKLNRIEQLLQVVQRDLEGKDGRFSQLQETLRSSHLSLTENLQGHLLSGKSSSVCSDNASEHFTNLLFSSHLTAITSSAPRMGFFIFCLIAFQVLLVIGYVVYKRRRANMPKKYL